jgi:hypothetical protein
LDTPLLTFIDGTSPRFEVLNLKRLKGVLWREEDELLNFFVSLPLDGLLLGAEIR